MIYLDAYLLLYLSRPLFSREFFRKINNCDRRARETVEATA
jgi:hypothetical protein